MHRWTDGRITNEAEAVGRMRKEFSYCQIVDDEEMFLRHRRFFPVVHGELLAFLLRVDVNVPAGEVEIERGVARCPIDELLSANLQIRFHIMFEHEISAHGLMLQQSSQRVEELSMFSYASGSP